MAPRSDDFHQVPAPAGSPLARDRGLRRNRRLTRWIAVMAVAGAAALGSLYTHLLPGGSAAPAPPAPPTTASVHSPAASSAAATASRSGEDDDQNSQGDDEGEGGSSAARPAPQAPAQPPAPSSRQPHATTGAS